LERSANKTRYGLFEIIKISDQDIKEKSPAPNEEMNSTFKLEYNP
jgi:hypothetical protein